MVPWWLFLVLFIALPASERINRSKYWLLTAGQGCAPLALTTYVGWTDTFLTQGLAYIPSFLFFTTVVRPRYVKKHAKIVVDHSSSLLGRELLVEQRVGPGEEGSAIMSDRPFDVRNVGPAALEAGDRCVVRELDEFILLVSAADDSAPA